MTMTHSKIGRREFLVGAAASAPAILTNPASGETSLADQQRRPPDSKSSVDEFAYRTTEQLVADLAERRVSATELVEQSIKRIETFDGRINAVVVRDFERARAAAVAADAALARGERRPLLGVPMTVKEAFNVAGLATTWGRPQAKNFIPGEDAVAVSRLKAAGAIILGKTNVPLDLADSQSYNDVYGTTNNPWNLNLTPGGSSGGAAASLAAGYVSLELGSDIGGSLRTPAHFCGVFAHKPSTGLLPSRGQTPPGVKPLPHESDLAVIGPMARSAGDLALAFDILAGPDAPQAVGWRLALPPSRHDTLKEFRILVVDQHPLLPTAASVRGPIDRLADRLAKLGATVARESPLLPGLATGARVYVSLLMAVFGVDMPSDVYQRLAKETASVPADPDNLNFLLGKGLSLDAVRDHGLAISHRDWSWADRFRVGFEQRWRDLFRDYDVVLCPPFPTPAFPHDHSPDLRARRAVIDGQEVPGGDQVLWAGVATMPGLPATAMPLERTDDGLPVGVQIIGPRLEDHTPLTFARLVESEFGGFVAPPLKS
jgi:amidase